MRLRIARWAEVAFIVLALFFVAGLPWPPAGADAIQFVTLAVEILVAALFAWALPRDQRWALLAAPMFAAVVALPVLFRIFGDLRSFAAPTTVLRDGQLVSVGGGPVLLLVLLLAGGFAGLQLLAALCCVTTPQFQQALRGFGQASPQRTA